AVVQRAQLGVVVAAGPELLDPGGREQVLLGAPRARKQAVGDLADERVPERVLVLAADRGRLLAADQLPALERAQQPAQRLAVAGDRLERPGPEPLADDGRVD